MTYLDFMSINDMRIWKYKKTVENLQECLPGSVELSF